MTSPSGPTDDEALRTEIQAAIAAGRELDPTMDRHLADSVLERYRQQQRQQVALAPKSVASPVARPFDAEAAGRLLLPVAGVATFVAIIVFRPELWWVIFFLPMLFGWFGWNRWSHGTSTTAKRRDHDHTDYV